MIADATTDSPSLFKNVLILCASLFLMGLLLAGLVLPWVWDPAPGGDLLARYAPLSNGESLLYAVQDPSTAAISTWDSYNIRTLPVGQALINVLDDATRNALVDFYYGEAEMTADLAEIGSTHTRLCSLSTTQSECRCQRQHHRHRGLAGARPCW